MDQPQSPDQVQAFVDELRLAVNDPLLGVRWEPRAVMVARGGYDVTGKVKDPVYRGLWEIIRDSTRDKTATWRSWTRICFVTQPVRVEAGLDAMVQDGLYAPLGEWLITFLKQANLANLKAAQRVRRRLEALNERNDEAALRAEDAAAEEAASRIWHKGTAAGGGVAEFHPVGVTLDRAP